MFNRQPSVQFLLARIESAMCFTAVDVGRKMTFEGYLRRMRRKWPAEERLKDRRRRQRNRQYFWKYVQCPLRPEDTVYLVREELAVINYLSAPGKSWTKLWKMVNDLAGNGPVGETRPKRQALLALITRMIHEKKLVRFRKTNEIRLALWLDPAYSFRSKEPVGVPDVPSTPTPQTGDGFILTDQHTPWTPHYPIFDSTNW